MIVDKTRTNLASESPFAQSPSIKLCKLALRVVTAKGRSRQTPIYSAKQHAREDIASQQFCTVIDVIITAKT